MLFDQPRILRQLHGYNPWWSGGSRPTPTFERVAFAKCLARLRDPKNQRAVMLSGPRRVGKSTILFQLARRLVADGEDARSIVYLSLDDNILKLVGIRELLAAYRSAIWPEDRRAILLIDEVHYAPDWDVELKTLIDHHPHYRIVATGSASVDHARRVAHSGVGRWTTINIPTLSFYEFLSLMGKTPKGVSADLRPSDLSHLGEGETTLVVGAMRPVLPLFRRYMLVGGFPETARIDDVAECQRLLREDIVDKVLKRDMTALFGIRNVLELEKLFLYICLHSGLTLNVSTCSSELGVPRATVNDHLELLVKANLLYRVPPFERSGKKVLKAQHKYYLVDAALRNAILLAGEEALNDPTELGRIVETTVLRHVHSFYYRDTPSVTYACDPVSRREVDIVVRSPSYLIAIEVKHQSDVQDHDFRAIVEFCEAEPVSAAFLVTQRDADVGVLPRAARSKVPIVRVPAHLFTYLLGQAERS